MVKSIDCFAYKYKECTALKVSKCEGIKCGFYKSKKMYRLGRKKAIKRILSLPDTYQQYIIDTYYDGKKLK